MDKSNVVVLVTGASGFVGINCVARLLADGYAVRGTVRSLSNDKKVQPIKDVAGPHLNRLQLVEADLLKAESWNAAVEGVDFVLHVASPFSIQKVTDEQELIRPAVDGTLNVLKAVASAKNRPKRVVLTSSLAAIEGGHEYKTGETMTLTESLWTNVDGPGVNAYTKSKALAEKSAWDFVAALPDDEKFELVTMNPGFIIGPFLHNVEAASAEVIKKVMTGGMPLVPKLSMPTIDVRDVALAHIRGMEIPEAAGKRFILGNRPVPWLKDIAQVLQAEFKPQGYSVSTMEAPNLLLKVISFFGDVMKNAVPRLGHQFDVDNSLMKNLLKVPGRPMKDSLIEMAYSLIEREIIPKTTNYKAPSKN